MLPYSGRAELEKHFSDPNLTVHFYTDSEVFATAERFEAGSMVMIDENAFSDNGCYTLVYCPKAQQQQYDALFSTQTYVVVKGSAMPYKNDGAVAIFNKKARLPQLTRDLPVVTEEDPRIREMLNQVNMDSLEATVQHLQDYGSRIWNSDNAFAASDWIASRMQALGLEVEQQPFNANTWMGSGEAAPNVIGIQRGTLYPDTYVVCGSHFDSFSYEAMFGGGTAPGADDNATGVASVLESARIMTQYEFEYSIIYCAYGCEEMGLYGSEAYASRCQEQGMDSIGYFNNDMNGYLNPGDPIHIDCIYPNSVEPIGTYYMNVGEVYYPELPIRHVNFNEGDSDHTSFNNHGYLGIYPFEDYENYSPYIHTPNDVIGTSVTSCEMSQQYCQMNLACLAEIANPVGETPQVYCNPVIYFDFLQPVNKEVIELVMFWEAPEEGSSGELEHFDVYRDNMVIATQEYDPNYSGLYYFEDTISIGATAEYFIMSVYSDGCEAPSETLIGEGIPSSVNELESGSTLVYPNPSNGTFNLNLGAGQWNVEVYDITGRKVYESRMDGRSILDLGACRKGMYFLKATGESRGVTAKVMVQ